MVGRNTRHSPVGSQPTRCPARDNFRRRSVKTIAFVGLYVAYYRNQDYRAQAGDFDQYAGHRPAILCGQLFPATRRVQASMASPRWSVLPRCSSRENDPTYQSHRLAVVLDQWQARQVRCRGKDPNRIVPPSRCRAMTRPWSCFTHPADNRQGRLG